MQTVIAILFHGAPGKIVEPVVSHVFVKMVHARLVLRVRNPQLGDKPVHVQVFPALEAFALVLRAQVQIASAAFSVLA